MKQLKNGDVIVSFQAGGIDEIVSWVLSWVLSWGAQAHVLGPKQVIDCIIQHLNIVNNHYKCASNCLADRATAISQNREK